MKNLRVKEIVLAALGMALVFLATYLIKIPNGIQGYFNLGDGFIMLFSSLMNPWLAFMIAGVGSALADLVGGYGSYALFTLIIKGIEGVIIALAFQRITGRLRFVSYGIAAGIMVFGYCIADSIINASLVLGISGIPANILQGVIGIVIALLAFPMIQKNMKNM